MWSVAFGPNDWTILAGSEDGLLTIWDTASRQEFRSYNIVGGRDTRVAFSPDGSMILAGTGEQEAILQNVSDGQVLRSFQIALPVTSVAFSRDGRSVLIGAGNTLTVWNIDLSTDEINQLIAWAYDNLDVRELTCVERLLYRFEPYCDAEGKMPTGTPFPTLRATAAHEESQATASPPTQLATAEGVG